MMEKHIVLLSDVVPDLVSIPVIGNLKFVRVVQIKCTLQNALLIIERKINDL